MLQEKIHTTELPLGYQFRAPTLEDVEATVGMFNAHERWFNGKNSFRVADTRAEWSMPGVDLDDTSRLVLTADGQVAGYYEIWDEAPFTVAQLWGRIHPDHFGRGIGSFLLDWALSHAQEKIDKAPPEARISARAYIYSSHHSAAELFLNTGFTPIRYSLRMVIELKQPPTAVTAHEGITFRSMESRQEMRAVFSAMQESFRDHWGYVERSFEEGLKQWSYYWENTQDFDPSLWFLALDGDEIAGISLCKQHSHDEPEMGWVSTLGVRRPWRRRGLGMALLQHSFDILYQRGQRKVGLGVDAESLTGATRLYEKAGMRPDAGNGYTLFERELRPGIELSTQSIE
jgi:mycothiol synthase